MKRFICLCAALCMMTTSALAGTNEQLLWAVEVAQECELLAGSPVYGDFSGLYGDSQAIASGWATGDHASPAAVYRFTTDLDMYLIIKARGQNVTEEMIPYMRQMAMNHLNLYVWYDEESASASYACSAIKSFVGECGYEWWLLCYDEGGDVLVTFIPYDNGTVFVQAQFLPAGDTGTLTGAMTVLQETYGLVTIEQLK